MVSLPVLIDRLEQSLPGIADAAVHQEVYNIIGYLKKLFLKVPEADGNQRFNRYLTQLENAAFPVNGQPSLAKIRRCYNKVAESAAKEFSIVKTGYYRTLWMLLGMVCFGIPIGLIFKNNFGSVAFIGAGLPIGMIIGMALGTRLDKRAEQQGRVIY